MECCVVFERHNQNIPVRLQPPTQRTDRCVREKRKYGCHILHALYIKYSHFVVAYISMGKYLTLGVPKNTFSYLIPEYSYS